jgi:hypothetical protein
VKIRNILINALLASAPAVSQNLFFVSDSDQAKAQGATRPYVVLVNGYQDCCVWSPSNRGVYIEKVLRELQQRGAEFRLVPWDTFRDGARQRSSTSNDAAFLQEAADFINNRLDPNRPLILIGHSFGGDSLLSLVPRINRPIQFLGVIDPTAAGGLREPVTRRGVPSNVNYFFNRWQQNAVASANIVPFDSRLVNGSISGCRAKNCDQQEQSLARKENGSEIRISCGRFEVSCPGYQPWPGGSNGTKAKRLAHNDMPSDEYLQTQMANSISRVLAASPSPPPSSAANYRLGDGTIFFSNGRDAYCTYQNMEHWSFAANKELRSANSFPSLRNDGPCGILLPAGNYRQPDGLIFFSNGKDAFCAYRKVPQGPIRQLNAPVFYDRFMRNDGICADQ